jgi:hypothetical protein
MRKILLALVSLTITSPAFALSLADCEQVRVLEGDDKYVDCVLMVASMEQSEKQKVLTSTIEQQQVALTELSVELVGVRGSVTKLQKAPAAVSVTSQTPAPQKLVVQSAARMPLLHMEVERPGKYMCSTDPAHLRAAGITSVLHIKGLSGGADHLAGGPSGVMILAEKNGRILKIEGGQPIFADLDGDGKADTMQVSATQTVYRPYVALNPFGDLYCAASSGERVTLHYVRKTGRVIGTNDVWEIKMRLGARGAIHAQNSTGTAFRTARGGTLSW